MTVVVWISFFFSIYLSWWRGFYFASLMVEAKQPKQPLEDEWEKGWFCHTCTGIDGDSKKKKSFGLSVVNMCVSYRCSVMPMSLSSLTDSRGEMMSWPKRSYISTCKEGNNLHHRLVTSGQCHWILVLDCACRYVRARCVSFTFHTGSAAVFFGGGALKLSIRFRATVNTNPEREGVRQVAGWLIL